MKLVASNCERNAHLDYRNSPVLVKALVDAYETGRKRVKLDCSEIDSMSALLLGCIYETAERLRCMGGSLRLTGVNEKLWSTLPPEMYPLCIREAGKLSDEDLSLHEELLACAV